MIDSCTLAQVDTETWKSGWNPMAMVSLGDPLHRAASGSGRSRFCQVDLILWLIIVVFNRRRTNVFAS